MRRLLSLLVAAAALAGCDQMATQPREHVYGRSALFPNGMSMQAPPEGALARGDLETQAVLETRPPLTPALLARGQARYAIYCAVCHDAAGYGQGVVPSRGYPQPPSFHSARLRAASTRHFVDVITNGYGVMYAYRDRVLPADRWAIAAYIRALQLSQAAPAAKLAPAEQARLAADRGL
ncbi:MAG TPA: cytochrome c [Phenylobacterium sp.]|jgi:mono/diheme cytochrome c family protein|uniref:c-type cytochrome n=1 Tax=Phenylobacterium sp. TaxID=1871053 RepID=UPI002D233D89|nr:cytochrome c [Phenylobacterium sp.]HZZ70313.1 cytochrome c [Phenylobacterium sp.]